MNKVLLIVLPWLLALAYPASASEKLPSAQVELVSAQARNHVWLFESGDMAAVLRYRQLLIRSLNRQLEKVGCRQAYVEALRSDEILKIVNLLKSNGDQTAKATSHPGYVLMKLMNSDTICGRQRQQTASVPAFKNKPKNSVTASIPGTSFKELDLRATSKAVTAKSPQASLKGGAVTFRPLKKHQIAPVRDLQKEAEEVNPRGIFY